MSPPAANRHGVGRALVPRPDQERLLNLFVTTSVGPSAMLITGEAGIGKSTLWGIGIAAALGSRQTVLSTRTAQSEAELSFAGLADLLDRVDEGVFAALSDGQRDALDAALLRSGGSTAPNPRSIGAAVLAVLRTLAARAPVLIAIDDLQWLDSASTDALSFALRRLSDEPVRLLGSVRTFSALAPYADSGGDAVNALPAALPAGAVEMMPSPPLHGAELGTLIESRLGLVLSTQTLTELRERTGGNPFWALEVARAVVAAGSATGLPVPESLATSVDRRLRGLPDNARMALLVVAALSHPSVAFALKALRGQVDDARAALDAAVEAGVLEEVGGRLHPAHPLLASVALLGLPPGRRSDLHRWLAGVAEDPEQRARHLALAANGEPDAEVAGELDAGVAAARSRGAARAAAELAEMAIILTPLQLSTARAARQLAAAELRYSAGESLPAQELARRAAADGTQSVQVAALCLLAMITYYLEGSGNARADLHRALEIAGDDPVQRARALAGLADMGDHGASIDMAYAQESLALLDTVPDALVGDIRTSALLGYVGARIDVALGMDEDAIAAAANVEAAQAGPRPIVLRRVAVQTSFWFKIVDQLDRSRTALHKAIELARDEGEDSALSTLLGHLVLTECWAGRYEAALSAADEGMRSAAKTGWMPVVLYGGAGLTRVLTGDFDVGRQLVRDNLGYGETYGHHRADTAQLHVLGLADLLTGDPASAADQLTRALEIARSHEVHEPGRRQRLEADLGQALVSVGRLDEAATLAAEQIDLGRRADRPGVLAVGLRIDGLVRAAREDLDGAVAVLLESLGATERAPFPLEYGRTLLALGQVHRRRRAKQSARECLSGARDRFAQLGATPYRAIAEGELRRVSGAQAGDALTATEQRVAELVTAGRTNREVATELFTSVRTVEGHVASIYRKLGVRSRAALANYLNTSASS